ncbi:sterol desaturase family protein, partial [Methylomonas sp. WSC-6]|nr:sterol desaturase family protein [Methylomonas sp. WSC-6]
MEALLRFGVFFGIFALMAVWEYFRPKRRLSSARRQRWPVNLGLAAVNVLLMRVSMGAAAWLA